MIHVITPLQANLMEKKAFELGMTPQFFMENAGAKIAEAIHMFIEEEQLAKECVLLCGKGNNAGDAYCAGYALLQKGYVVQAHTFSALHELTPLCKKMAEAFYRGGGKKMASLQDIPQNAVILDGLFGTGFKGELKDAYLTLVKEVNALENRVISIDIPSGLNGETGEVKSAAIKAHLTLSLGHPQHGFFIGEGWNHVGKILILDFGLPQEMLHYITPKMMLLEERDVQKLLPPLVPNRHKYQAGAVLALTGSKKYEGAAYLSCLSAYRAGAGIVTLLQQEGVNISLPELIKVPLENNLSEYLKEMRHHAFMLGCGLGTSGTSQEYVRQVCALIQTPIVIDADGLNIMALTSLAPPKNALLTPHFKEMCRLLNNPSLKELHVTEEFISLVQNFVDEKNCTVVLKGGPSFIFSPSHPPLISTRGTPGMATAGAGDVLTGVLAALLAQSLDSKEAACLGVYLHGLAGEYAEEKCTAYSMMAQDIVEHLPQAFKHLCAF
jgi:ADP-dependent NAD(P)H-hydrate dehydratase / NAD(P)H-hydrate epimerase